MVQICTFDGAERIGPPRSWNEEKQGKCLDIYIARSMEGGVPWMHTVYRFSSEEIEALALGGCMRLTLPGTTHPVFRLGVLSPSIAYQAGVVDAPNAALGGVLRAADESLPVPADAVMRLAREAWAEGGRTDEYRMAVRGGAKDDEIPKAVIRAVQLALIEATPAPAPSIDDYVLPCDVLVAPATKVKAGVTMGTLISAIQARDEWIASGNEITSLSGSAAEGMCSNSYDRGNEAFAALRNFLITAHRSIGPGEFELVIECPDDGMRKTIVEQVRADTPNSIGNRPSAAQAGNFGGTWFGIPYRFAAPGDTAPDLRTALQHIRHMAAWIGAANRNGVSRIYSFESLNEDYGAMCDAAGLNSKPFE